MKKRPRKRDIRHRFRNRYAKSLGSGTPFKSKTILAKKNRYKRKKQDLKDTIEGEGEDTGDLEPVQPSNVHLFTVLQGGDKANAQEASAEGQELLKIGIDTFAEEAKAEGTEAFIAIIYDKNFRSHRLLVAGEIDPTYVLGSLELVKHEILKIVG